MNNTITEFKNIFEEISKVKNEIEINTQERNDFIIKNANKKFDEIQVEIDTVLNMIDEVFPLEKIGAMTGNLYESYRNVKDNIIICELDPFDKTILFRMNKFKRHLHVTNNKELYHDDKYDIPCSLYAKQFDKIEDQDICLTLFYENISKMFDALENSLKRLQEENETLKEQIKTLKSSIIKNNEPKIIQLNGYKITIEKE